jgi:tRNA threonylcarbamoyladenosine biosynthesis protein TsaE
MPILDDRTVEFVSGSPEQTHRLGVRLGELLRGGELICLEGGLGSGKTCFAQGLGLGWGAGARLRSPTFTLINEWKRPGDSMRLCHIDLYRVTQEAEAWSLGIEELWNGLDICVIEWPERIAKLLPLERLWVHMSVIDDTRRRQVFTAQGVYYEDLLKRFKHATFGA